MGMWANWSGLLRTGMRITTLNDNHQVRLMPTLKMPNRCAGRSQTYAMAQETPDGNHSVWEELNTLLVKMGDNVPGRMTEAMHVFVCPKRECQIGSGHHSARW